MSYTPQPDSLPARVIEWLQANPDEELTCGDIAYKFGAIRAREGSRHD